MPTSKQKKVNSKSSKDKTNNISKFSNLTLSLLTYSDINKLESLDRINKILDIILKNRIVILQGRLDANEEASLIQSTMALVGRIKDFRGIELAVISPENDDAFFNKLKDSSDLSKPTEFSTSVGFSELTGFSKPTEVQFMIMSLLSISSFNFPNASLVNSSNSLKTFSISTGDCSLNSKDIK